MSVRSLNFGVRKLLALTEDVLAEDEGEQLSQAGPALTTEGSTR